MNKKNKKENYSIDLTSYVQVDKKEAWEKVSNRLSFNSKSSRKRSLFHYKAISAAAILVVAIGMSAYRFTQKSISNTNYIVEMPRIPIPNEAILIRNDRGEIIETTTNHTDIALIEKSSITKEKQFHTEATTITIEIPHGKIHRLTLSDGSIVTLNANSKLSFPSRFNNDQREVTIEGEGFFEVQKSTTPFVVKYHQNSVKVLGTKFNVSAYPNAKTSSTTLVSGSVEMSTINGKDRTTKVITPNERYSYNTIEGDVSIDCVDTDYITSWMKDVFEFHNMSLSEIVEQMERWYHIDIEFGNDQLKEIQFTGSAFKNRDINDLFEVLEKLSDIKFHYTVNKTILITN